MIAIGALFAVGVMAAAFFDWSVFNLQFVLGTAAFLMLGGMAALAYADSPRPAARDARQWRGAGTGTLFFGGIVALGCLLAMSPA